MVTIYGPIKTLNFYERLKQDYNFDVKKFALAERHLTALGLPMLEKPRFGPDDDLELFQ